jgi:agmatine/peptidylarginine deiminase
MRWWQWSKRTFGWARWPAVLAIVAAAFWAGTQWRSVQASRPYTGLSAPALPGGANQPAGTPLPPRPLPPPGEFEHQAAIVLVCNELVPCFPGVFKEVVAATWRSVPVICLVANEIEQQLAMGLLRDAGLPETAVTFALVPLDTMWVRDYGPVFVKRTDGSIYAVNLDYTPLDEAMEVRWRDNNAPRLIGDLLGVETVSVPLRLGMGNLLSNGEGLCVTTAGVVRENMDRGYDAAKIDSLLTEHMGFRHWLCLKELDGERTGHVDMFVTLLAADQAVVGQMDPNADPMNARLLDDAAAQLARQQTPHGPMRVARIPMPPPDNGQWRSYTNVIFANRTLLVPAYTGVDAAMQEKAMAVYSRLLPGWRIVPINADALVPSEGMLHCVSLNLPDFVPLTRVSRPKGRLMDDFGRGPGTGHPASGPASAPAPAPDGHKWRAPDLLPDKQQQDNPAPAPKNS